MTFYHHGTSLKQLCKIRDAGWVVRNLYVSDLEDEPEHYADQQSRRDRSCPAFLVIDDTLLSPDVQQELTPEHVAAMEECMDDEIEESYRAHRLLSGPIRLAIVRAYYIDEEGEHDLLTSPGCCR